MPLSMTSFYSLSNLQHWSVVRYLVVGGGLFVLDYSIAHTLYFWANQSLAIAQWSGRLVGALVGYFLHRAYTFQIDALVGTSIVRYWFLTTVLWIASPALVSGIYICLPEILLKFFIAKVFSEILIVTTSYWLMRRFIFKKGS